MTRPIRPLRAEPLNGPAGAAGGDAVRHFDLVSHWQLAAPVERVWGALVAPERWPQWWPYVAQATQLRRGGDDGVGSVHRLAWRTRLPYRLLLEVETTEVVRLQRLRGRARGDLQGEGIWLLDADGRHTHVTYVWRVQLQRPWQRALAPWMAPLFRWSHDGVMRAGGAGLQRRLG